MKSSYCIRSSLSWPAVDLFHATRNVRLKLCNPPSDRCKKYQKINIINIISMVFYGFFYGSIINNFYGSIISRLFYCFLIFFLWFNQVQSSWIPIFFSETPWIFLLDLPWKCHPNLHRIWIPKDLLVFLRCKKRPKKKHPAGRRQKKLAEFTKFDKRGF